MIGKSFLSFALMALLMVAGGWLVGPLTATDATATDDASTDRAATMKALVARLEKLEARVAELEAQTAPVIRPADFTSAVQALPETPKGWSRREFNGVEYFIVPLTTNKNFNK